MRSLNQQKPVVIGALFTLLFAVASSGALAQEKSGASPASTPAEQPEDPKVTQDKLARCNPNKVTLACPGAKNKQVTVPVERRSYPLNKETCLPNNGRPGKPIITAMLDHCPVAAKCKKSLPGRVDGCSVPKPLFPQREEVQELFGAACVGHDLCYNTHGVKKALCDGQFKSNMFAICNVAFTKPLPLWSSCIVQAEAVYEAVANLADSSFESDQKWAKDHCTGK